jgi:hypothetical protein
MKARDGSFFCFAFHAHVEWGLISVLGWIVDWNFIDFWCFPN